MQGACVQDVLDSIVPALLADKNRKFIFVEQAMINAFLSLMLLLFGFSYNKNWRKKKKKKGYMVIKIFLLIEFFLFYGTPGKQKPAREAA